MSAPHKTQPPRKGPAKGPRAAGDKICILSTAQAAIKRQKAGRTGKTRVRPARWRQRRGAGAPFRQKLYSKAKGSEKILRAALFPAAKMLQNPSSLAIIRVERWVVCGRTGPPFCQKWHKIQILSTDAKRKEAAPASVPPPGQTGGAGRQWVNRRKRRDTKLWGLRCKAAKLHNASPAANSWQTADNRGTQKPLANHGKLWDAKPWGLRRKVRRSHIAQTCAMPARLLIVGAAPPYKGRPAPKANRGKPRDAKLWGLMQRHWLHAETDSSGGKPAGETDVHA